MPPVDIEANYWQQALEFFWAGQDNEKFLALPNDIELTQGSCLAGILSIWVDAGNGDWDLCKIEDVTPSGDDIVSCEHLVKQRLSKDERRKRKRASG